MRSDWLKEERRLHDRYRIRKILGEGGFGITYLAEDEALGQSVVIKEYFPRDIAGRDPESQDIVLPKEKNDRKRFRKGKKDFLLEARRMSWLFDVPAVVKILDWFEEHETAYLAMEYVRGISLDRFLQRRDVPFSFGEAWELLKPAAEALYKIHRKGIIHRDLNPENMMVQEDGTIKIIDFGAARKYLETEKTMTILVKKGYAPPEQYMEKGKQGPWTDVYAFCATLYEMVTGVRPEPSPDRVQKDRLYLPSAYGAEILPEEEEILCRGLELDPERRFRSMKDLILALEPRTEDRKEKKRLFRTAGITAAAFFCVIAAAAAVFVFHRGENQEEVSYAGNYGRQTEKYRDYLEFVKANAVSVEEGEDHTDFLYQGKSTVYTLDPGDVQEWGEPCNQLRFDRTADEFLSRMEKRGYSLEKKQETETDTVEIFPYGAVLTDFEKEELYETEDGIRVLIRSDSVNRDLFSVVFFVEEEAKEQIKEMMTDTAEFLDHGVSVSREEMREEIEELETRRQRDGWMSSRFNYWLGVIDEENGGPAWTFGVNHRTFRYAWYYWP